MAKNSSTSMSMPMDGDECCFCPDESTNAARGPTDKQPDADSFQEKLRVAIEDRCGKATSPQSGMSPKSE